MAVVAHLPEGIGIRGKPFIKKERFPIHYDLLDRIAGIGGNGELLVISRIKGDLPIFPFRQDRAILMLGYGDILF